MGNISMGSNNEVHSKQMNPPGLYILTLRAPNGMEQQIVAYIPNEQVRQHYIDKAHKSGLQIEIKNINESK